MTSRWLRIGRKLGCGLRQLHRETALLVRDDHKNDQQHQQDVDQRNHVHFNEDSAIRTAN